MSVVVTLDGETARPGPVTLSSMASDPDGFALLYRDHYGRLVRALEIAGCEPAAAQDAAQEAFARTLLHWPRVRVGTNPAGYVFRTAFRLVNRDRRRRRGEAEAAHDSAVPGPEGAVVVRVSLDAALAAMPARQRSCVGLCLYLGLSAEEAGAALRIDAATVRVHLHRARIALKEVLR